jgi:hypothetical protein
MMVSFFAYMQHRLKADASVQSEARFAGLVAVAVGFKPMAAQKPECTRGDCASSGTQLALSASTLSDD